MSGSARPLCLIVQPIAEPGLTRLRAAGLALHLAERPDFATLRPVLAQAQAVITRNAGFPAEAIAAAPRLVVIGSHGSGTDAIDRAGAERRGIAIVNTPGTNAQSVAELTIGLILAAARRIPAADRALRANEPGFRLQIQGQELAGRTLGLVGFGQVARRVAPLGRAFGMTVVGVSRHADAATMAAAGATKLDGLAALLAISDIVSLHASGGSGTLIGPAELAAMKPGSLLVNTARGSLLDEAALARALADGHLDAAALDVTAIEPLPPDSPLRAAPNLILTPHIGGVTSAALDRTASAVAERVIEVLYERGVIRSPAG